MRIEFAAEEQRTQRLAYQRGHRETQRGPGDRDQQALGEELLGQPPPCRAHGQPRRQFPLSRRAPRHQQAG